MAHFESDVTLNRGGNKTVFMYSGLMLFFLFFMYFFSKQVIFDGILTMESSSSVLYSAIVAVVTVHIVLSMFVVWAALNEKSPTPPTLRDAKQD